MADIEKETRAEYLARKQRERRANLRDAGLPRPKSGPSGGVSSQGERAKRYRENKKKRTVDARDDSGIVHSTDT